MIERRARAMLGLVLSCALLLAGGHARAQNAVPLLEPKPVFTPGI